MSGRCDDCNAKLGGSRYSDGSDVLCYSCYDERDETSAFDSLRRTSPSNGLQRLLGNVLGDDVETEGDAEEKVEAEAEKLRDDAENSDVLTGVETAEGDA